MTQDERTLHDAGVIIPPRTVAHSYADEVYRKPTYDWYRPSVGEQIQQAAGCLAHMAALLIGSLVIWGLLVAIILAGPA